MNAVGGMLFGLLLLLIGGQYLAAGARALGIPSVVVSALESIALP
jgi:hypothetical protein